jgi:hypothetical protein
MQLDYAVASYGLEGFTVMIGDADGPTAASGVPSCTGSGQLLAADFNTDGHVGAWAAPNLMISMGSLITGLPGDACARRNTCVSADIHACHPCACADLLNLCDPTPWLHLGTGNGTFGAGMPVAGGQPAGRRRLLAVGAADPQVLKCCLVQRTPCLCLLTVCPATVSATTRRLPAKRQTWLVAHGRSPHRMLEHLFSRQKRG